MFELQLQSGHACCMQHVCAQVCCLSLLFRPSQKSFVHFYAPLCALCLNNSLLIYLHLFSVLISFLFFVIHPTPLSASPLCTHALNNSLPLPHLSAFYLHFIYVTFIFTHPIKGKRYGGDVHRTKTVSIMCQLNQWSEIASGTICSSLAKSAERWKNRKIKQTIK